MKKLAILSLAAGAALVPAAAVAAPPPPPPPMHHPAPVMRHHGTVRVHPAPVVTHHAPPAVVVPHDGPYGMDGAYYDEGYDGGYDDYYDGADGSEGDYPPPPPPPYGHQGYGYGGYGYAPGGMITVTETTVKTYGGCDCVEVHHAPVKHIKKYRSKSHYAPRKRVRHHPGERG